ncbi:hypothetical protein Vadar_002240 [Vaccinium darrowii]|uniref:Uncharacterized protein n=1 Tax=Vaccinium darrowii TaxID=229202 RepID=A0ACB7Y5W0_9ERIC|nr:hypothetical protein Vadar_002240 [Vaccinium darrowii]
MIPYNSSAPTPAKDPSTNFLKEPSVFSLKKPSTGFSQQKVLTGFSSNDPGTSSTIKTELIGSMRKASTSLFTVPGTFSYQKGQLGHGDTIQHDRSTVVSELSKHKIIGAGAGRSHTVVVTKDAISFAFGWNKHGQLGSGSMKNETESFPVRCLVYEVKSAVCGGDFTAWLTSAEGASILTAGLPQYGQLGHGTDNEFNTKESSVRLAYEGQPRPKALASLAGETIVKVACGTNHIHTAFCGFEWLCLHVGLWWLWKVGGCFCRLQLCYLGVLLLMNAFEVLDMKLEFSDGIVVSFPWSSYFLSSEYRLGHRGQRDEWLPFRADVFTRHNVLPPNAVISAGSVNSSWTAGGGQLYTWGKIKNTDLLQFPRKWRFLMACMSSGCYLVGVRVWVSNAENVFTGGYFFHSVACGFAHSMVVIDRTNIGDRLDQLDVYDGKAFAEGVVEWWSCGSTDDPENVLMRVKKSSNVRCLEKFTLKLHFFHNSNIVKSWISNAIKRKLRKVQKLELHVHFTGGLPIQLPRATFICETLVELTLYGSFSVKTPASVWLPNLKILTTVDLSSENGDSAQKLIHGCPVLEYLDVYRGDVESGENVEHFGAHIEASAARINIDLSDSGPINSINILKLLRGVANVKFLWFHADVKEYVQPTFPTLKNLTHLRLTSGLDCNGFNLNFLNDFLKFSPNLQVLVLEVC